MSVTAAARGPITVSIMLATVMQAIDTTIATVALPHMQGNLSATQDQISWVLTSYIVAVAIATPPTGWLAARLGRKRLFGWAVVGFTVASMLCGAATSLEQIVLFRLLQGVFGACLIPLSQAILLDTWPREKHGQAMAMWGVGVMIGPILGPTVGGWLTEFHGWRWVFYINVPFGVLAWLGIMAFVPETETERDRPFDMLGFALLSLGIGSLQLMLDRGESQDWFNANEIVIEGVLAATCLAMFIVHVLTHDRPFVNPRLFRDRNLVAGLLLAFTVGIVMLATMVLLPPFLQNLQGYPVITTGMVMAPRGVGTMVAMIVVGRLVGRVDPRLLMAVGLSISAWAMWEMTWFSLDVGAWAIVRTGMMQGFGLGFVFVPMSTVTFSTLDPRLRNEAASLYALMRNIGSSIGISVVVAMLAQSTQTNHALMAERVSPFNPVMRAPILPPGWTLDTVAGLSALNAEVTRQAALIAYVNDFMLMAVVTAASIPLVLLLRRPPRAGSPG